MKWTLPWVLVLAVGCANSSGAEPETDADADAVVDSDSETVADTETDAVADTETDAVADTEPDLEPDAVSDAEPDLEPDTEPDAVSDAEPDLETDTEPDAVADTETDVTDPPKPAVCEPTSCSDKIGACYQGNCGLYDQEACFASGVDACWGAWEACFDQAQLCGDGTCDGPCETCSSCPEDCGACSAGCTGEPWECACRDLAAAVCPRYQTCAPHLYAEEFASGDDCQRYMTDRCLLETLSPGSGVGMQDLDACAADVASLECAAVFGTGWESAEGVGGWAQVDDLGYFPLLRPASCRPAGSRADGEPCRFHSQCASGSCGGEHLRCGVCVDLPVPQPAGLGQPCGPQVPCELGLQCGQSGAVCVVPGKIGDPCVDGTCDFHVEGAWCSNATGTCKAPVFATSFGEQCVKILLVDPDNEVYEEVPVNCGPDQVCNDHPDGSYCEGYGYDSRCPPLRRATLSWSSVADFSTPVCEGASVRCNPLSPCDCDSPPLLSDDPWPF